MTTTEFSIELDTTDEGLGDLFITDARLLVRPRRVPGLYPSSVNHDTIHAYNVLSLAYDMNQYQWHMFFEGNPRTAHKLLDRVFYAFVDACCLQQWCDARVCYIVDGQTVHVEEYGFSDGQYTLVFSVYCGITDSRTEGFLATLTAGQETSYVVVRPDSTEYGYSLRGFNVEPEPEDDLDDYWPDDSYDDSEDEDPLAGDIDDGSHYVAGPNPLNTQHYHALQQRGLL